MSEPAVRPRRSPASSGGSGGSQRQRRRAGQEQQPPACGKCVPAVPREAPGIGANSLPPGQDPPACRRRRSSAIPRAHPGRDPAGRCLADRAIARARLGLLIAQGDVRGRIRCLRARSCSDPGSIDPPRQDRFAPGALDNPHSRRADQGAEATAAGHQRPEIGPGPPTDGLGGS